MNALPLCSVLLAGTAAAQAVLPPFNATWQMVNLGPLGAGVSSYGGTAFVPGNPNQLMLSPWPSNTIYMLPLTRDGAGRIDGFGTAVPTIAVPGTDGGLAYGPNGVLFGTWFGQNAVHQTKPASIANDRSDDLAPLGVFASVGACAFVPAGLPGAGRFKVCSWTPGTFFDVALTPDGNGTFVPGPASAPVQMPFDCEGLVYAPASTPLFGGQLLVCEWSQGNIAMFQVDAQGDPLPATRQLLAGGAPNVGGGAYDPVSGDFVFLGAYGTLLVLRAAATPCGTFQSYGTASPGSLGTPTIGGSGCARLGDVATLQLGSAANNFGLLAMGSYQVAWPFENLTVLQSLDVVLTIAFGPTGTTTLPVTIPPAPSLGYSHLYFQTAALDPGTSSGLSASNGLDMQLR
jgi:hypothetical protein